MLFGDDIVLVVETKEEVNRKLEECTAILKDKGLLISRKKTEYLRCDFSGKTPIGKTKVFISEEVVTSTTKYRYLGSIIQSRYLRRCYSSNTSELAQVVSSHRGTM